MAELSDDPLSSFHDDDTLFLHGNLPMMVRILAMDLHQWLASRPLTWLQSRKYSSCRMRKWEYRVCHCGCWYRISFTQVADADGEYYEVKESARIPSNHCNVDESPDNTPLTKDVLMVINKLVEHHEFTKNYSPKRLVTDLWCQGTKFRVRSNYRIICITFIKPSSYISTKSAHWRRSFIITYMRTMMEKH